MIDNDSNVEAITYVAMAKNVVKDSRPSQEYLERIVTGSRQHGLPEEYIERIKQMASASEE